MNKAPSDFPRQNSFSALSGAQPKLSVLKIDGRYYLEQPDEDEIYQRYDVCADLGNLCISSKRMCLHMRAGCGSIPAHAAI